MRRTTVFRLEGSGVMGVGEDVTYAAEEHGRLVETWPFADLRGDWTVESFSAFVGGLDLFPAGEPAQAAWRHYRRWALESAALDLALHQAGLSLAQALDRPLSPVSFVVSLRLGEPPTLEPLRRRLAIAPGLTFKLDATSSWSDGLIAELAALRCVASVDLKAYYAGTVVDQELDVALYERVLRGFPGVWIEDPAVTPATEPLLAPQRDRLTWDAPIHSVADIEALPFPPRTINVKPSRFGSVAALFAAYDWCEARGVGMYGGGQFELGPGRAQIQALASVFHPEGPNDIAPTGWNDPEPQAGLPGSPLPPPPGGTGLACGYDGPR